MRRYPADYRTLPAEAYPSYRVVVRTEEEKQQVLEASDYLHWFYVPFTGRSRRARLRHQGEGLDANYLIINSLMHLYCTEDWVWVDPTIAAPYVLVANEYSRDEFLEGSAYLDKLRIRARGKGTKKPGSVVFSGIDRAVPFANFFCGLYHAPDTIQLTLVPFDDEPRHTNPAN